MLMFKLIGRRLGLRRHFAFLAALLLGSTATVRAQQEFRAAWADVFHVGMGSQAEVNTLVAALVQGHYNAVIYQVVGYMDNNTSSHGAMYKSNILPWSSRVTASFDPLAYLCQQAHANGIEVHAWLGGSGGAMYRVSGSWPPAGNTNLAAHPEWFMAPLANSEGNAVMPVDSLYILDMGSPDAQEYVVSLVKEIVTNYPVDGINWDDEINGAGYTAGFGYPAYSQANYPRSGLARYRINTGYVGTPSNTDTAWADYRRRFKNEFMARVQAEIQSIKTNPRQPVRHTTAALAYSPVPSTCNFTNSSAYNYFCDWAAMTRNGWVDAVIPQTYSSSTFNSWADKIASCWQYNRQIFPGMGGYLTTDAGIAGYINYTRSKGLLGNAIYSYAVPNSAGNSDWWAYAAANVYTNVVTTPFMPWRNPATATEGIVWGRVKDGNTGLYVDDAIVAVSGATTVRSDGNGYYVATLVPATQAGTPHSATASKTGTTPQTLTVTALAGDIARYDFTLNAQVATPSGLSANAVSASQINLTWTDNATNETGYLVRQSLVSGGPYSTVGSLGANAAAFTNTGLLPVTTYYYVVQATNSTTSSSNSAQVFATTQVGNTAPFITTQPQSQTVSQNSNATFTVVANGAAPLFYQWQFYSTNLPGATDSSYTRFSSQPADAGPYSVTVSNALGTTNSSPATLTVIVPPLITAQPQNVTTNQGSNATFTVAASGTGPFGYQWRFNAANISGATASSYTRSNVQSSNAGNYSVTVSNFAGTALSSNALLTVIVPPAPPSIVTQPQGVTVFQGNPASLGVVAAGTAPLAYQWSFYGTNLPGATGTNLTFNPATTNNSGPYTVVITNAYGSITSQTATVTVTPIFQAGGISVLWSLAPGSRSYLATNSLPNVRGLSWNPVNNHLVLANRATTAVYVLDAATGADLHQMDANNVSGGTYNILLSGVADDGVVYAGNLTTAGSTTAYKLYRWPNDSASAAFATAFSGDPSPGNNQRWGDSMDVRGSGTNTQIILASRASTNVAIFTTTNGTNFASHSINVPGVPTGAFGLGVAFGKSNTFWGKANGQSLRQVSFDLVAGTGTVLRTHGTPGMPNSISPIGVTTNLNLLGGVNVGLTGNNFQLYDLTPSNGTPVFIASTNFVTDNENTGTGTGAVDFGNDKVWALGANNGILAMQILPAVVNVAPGITAQPQDVNVNQGSNATFSVTGTGSPFPAFQWRFNGTNIAGATDSAYTRVNAQPGQVGAYSVLLSNVAGTLISSNAQLTVNVGPGITTQPQDANVNQGSNAIFTVTATGTPNPAFQWRFNGTNISGATDSAYTQANAQPGDAGAYSVLLSNVAGTLLSSNAQLTVNVGPAIAVQPQGTNVNQGNNANFAVQTTGTPAPAYQWLFNSAPIGGATDASYTRANAQPGDVGGYSVLVSNIAGAVVSSNAQLTVNVGPGITTQPQDLNVNQGSNATFSVGATGVPVPAYQWLFNSAPIAGATSSSYTRANAQTNEAGAYSVSLSNLAGVLVSSNASLTVNVPPGIITQPQSITNGPNTDATFQITASGTAPLSYFWRFNGNPISGATASVYTRTNAQSADAGAYSVLVSNLAGFVTSEDAFLAVTQANQLRIDSIAILPGQGFQLQASGGPGEFAIDISDSLSGWTQLTSLSVTGAVFQYTDSETNQVSRYYRVRKLSP